MCVKTLWICVEKQICTHVPASSTACRHKCVLSVPSCADAAALPVGIHETQSNNLQVLPDVTELVESSQGSPITYPPVLMQLQCQGDSACAGMTPPSSMVIRARSWFLNLNWDLQMACVPCGLDALQSFWEVWFRVCCNGLQYQLRPVLCSLSPF